MWYLPHRHKTVYIVHKMTLLFKKNNIVRIAINAYLIILNLVKMNGSNEIISKQHSNDIMPF